MTEVEEELARTKAFLRRLQLERKRQDGDPSDFRECSGDLQGTQLSDSTRERANSTLVSPGADGSGAGDRQVSTADERDEPIDRTNDQPSLGKDLGQGNQTDSSVRV